MRLEFSLLALAAPLRERLAPFLRSDNAPRLISFPLHADLPTHPVRKRAQDIHLTGNRTTTSYYIQLYFGSTQQPVKLLVTTGASDTWVRSSCEDLSGDNQGNCTSYGVYDATKSSTSADLGSTQNITYADGNTVHMTYFTDYVWFGTGVPVKDVTFGVTNKTEINSGLLGLGFGESSQETNYLTFLDQLVSQGVIRSKAFSLALGNQSDSNNGVIIFGGVDTKKFSGKLTSLDILSPQGNDTVVRYYVQMTSISLSGPNGQSKSYGGSNVAIVPSLGTTWTYLPNNTLAAIARDIQGTRLATDGSEYYTVPCSQMDNTSYLHFNFAGVSIPVAISELVSQQGTTCYLELVFDTSGSSTLILGQNVLRSAYVVFDQTQGTLSLAQFIDCGQNEQELPTSGAAGFVGECVVSVDGGNQSHPSPTSTSQGPSATPTSAPNSTTSSDSGLSPGVKGGIAVGAIAGASALAALVFCLVWCLRRKAYAKSGQQPANPAELQAQTNPRSPIEVSTSPTVDDWRFSGQSANFVPPMTQASGSPLPGSQDGQRQWSPAKDWSFPPAAYPEGPYSQGNYVQGTDPHAAFPQGNYAQGHYTQLAHPQQTYPSGPGSPPLLATQGSPPLSQYHG